MAVKIKLARLGKIREPFYRVVVADARTRRGGRAIEMVGKYQPKAEPSLIDIDSERVQYWLGVGAQPTESVLALLKVTGDWQRFKGLPGAEGTLKPQPAKVDKRARYEAALAAIGGDDAPAATTPRKRAGKSADAADAAPKSPKESASEGASEGAKVAATESGAGTDAPYGPGSHAPLADGGQPDGFPIKGNDSSKLYHTPGSAFYDRTVAEVWFASTEAAEAAGFSLPKSQQGEA